MHAVSAGRGGGIALAGGFAADIVFGDPRRLHPVAGFGLLAQRLEAALYAPSRIRGLAYTALLVSLAAASAELAARLADRLPGLAARLADRLPGLAARLADRLPGLGPVAGSRPAAGRRSAGRSRRRSIGLGRSVVLAAVTWSALGGRSLTRVAGKLADQVDAGDLDAARETLPSLCGRDPEALDADGMCRAAVESVAENTSDAVVGALLWAALAGPGGVVAYRAANTLDAMVGHRSQRYREFGWAAARLDDLLNWPAARLTAILTALCAPLVGGLRRTTWETVRRDGAKHPSPNAGQVEAAFSGALGVGLGGRLSYDGVGELRPVIGAGPAPTAGDVRRATRLSLGVATAAVVCCAALRQLLLVRPAAGDGRPVSGYGGPAIASVGPPPRRPAIAGTGAGR
jgi:adenosylcobinamide-phosphate synthase